LDFIRFDGFRNSLEVMMTNNTSATFNSIMRQARQGGLRFWRLIAEPIAEFFSLPAHRG
jgi:hypothetical protein